MHFGKEEGDLILSITAKDLAKKLNLSEAAISMALHNKPGVSNKTRKRVIEAAEKYGYDFSRISTSETIQKEHGTIALMIYKRHGAVVTDTPFFSQLSEGISLGCKLNQYSLNIQYIYPSSSIDALIKNIEVNGMRGIILLGTEMQESDFLPFQKYRIPIVLLDTYFDKIPTDCIQINNNQGAYLAVSHLISKYHMQPGYLRSSYRIHNFDERADGFYKAIRENGMSTSASVVHRLSPSVEGSYADMKELLQQGEKVARCYFADNDLIAAGAMKAFKESGYKIPDDISIIGFDDMPVCTYLEPSLSTVQVPKQYMGELAAQKLISLIEGHNELAVKIEVSVRLIIRKS